MTDWRRRGVLAAIMVCSGSTSLEAQADAPAPPAESANDASLERAKELFRRGNELRKAGDCQAALALYLASRELVPAAANTMNAAFCLHQLRREDEALDLYEELIGRFPKDLNAEDTNAIAAAMGALRRAVGSLEISANVAGVVVVDGRMRGTLPLLAPIRLTPGRHVVRVIKDGFHTFERTIESEVGKMQAIDAVLTPLEGAGRLRIECPDLPGAAVFIDGANLGTCPFEGTLSPGPHLFWTRLGTRGSNPSKVEVLLGQTSRVTSTSALLGPELRVMVDPPSAQLSLDGVALGGASFQGPLTLGEHLFVAQDLGYKQQRVTVSGERGGDVAIGLLPDEAHPRWAKAEPDAPTGAFSLGADAAFVLLLSERGAAAARCGDGCESAPPIGVRGLVRGAWTSLSGFGVGLDVGGQLVRAAHSGRAITLAPIGLPNLENPGRIDQELVWRSLLVGATAFYRRPGEWPITVGVGAGVSIGDAATTRSGDFTNSFGTSYPAAQAYDSAATYAYVMPEARLGRSLGEGLELSLGATLTTHLAIAAPKWENEQILPTSPSPEDRGDGGAIFAAESLMGDVMLALHTSLALRWEFR